MAKIKFTKTELKSQQDALKQFVRFLPTLQLKKQQLQMEVRLSTEELERNLAEQKELVDRMSSFLELFSSDAEVAFFEGLVRVRRVLTGEENIREVIAFPMNSNAQDLLMGAPNEVTEQQLREVHIKLRSQQ